MKHIAFLSGLPRSGSTVLANILAMHSNIESTPSSPLCSIVQNMRRSWSDEPFLLSQLDTNGDKIYQKLIRTTKATIESWHDDSEKDIVIDKNRGWLFSLEWLQQLYPNVKMIVTLRDLRDVYASIEKRHRQTLFLDFPDHMEHNLIDGRASALFDNGGLIGSVVRGLQNIDDMPMHDIEKNVYYWRYEDFLEDRKGVTENLFEWLEVKPEDIDFENIIQSTWESDSYYRMKYSHRIYKTVQTPTSYKDLPLAPRIISQIENQFSWYFEKFYNENVVRPIRTDLPKQEADQPKIEIIKDEDTLVKDLEENIKAETS